MSKSTPSFDEPTAARLFSLAWPIIVSRSAQVIVGLCDAIMVGRLGEAELAATTTGSLNCFLLFCFPMGIAFIISSFTSQLVGQGKAAKTRRYGTYGLVIALMSAFTFVGLVPFLDGVTGMLPYAADVRALMVSYMSIRLVSGGFVVGVEALSNYYAGLGNTRMGMYVQVVVMALNVLLNWVLIFGHLGAPELGVAGAAYSSLISVTIGFAILLIVFSLRVAIPPDDSDDTPRFVGAEFGRVLRYGTPSGLNWFMEFAAFQLFVNVVVAGLGTTSLAAFNAVININSASFMPAFGLASAGAIVVGQAIGANSIAGARRAAQLTWRLCLLWQGAVGAICLLMPRLLVSAYVDDVEAASAFIDAGARMLMLSVAWQVFDAAVNTYAEALRAAGDTDYTLWARMVIAWAVFVPVSFITVRRLHLGDVAAVLCVVGYLGLLAGLLWRRWRGGAWERIELVS